MEKISLIVPCFNEEGNINMFYNAVVDVCNETKCLFEIIFIDDGSTDNTLNELKDLTAKNEMEIKVISFSRNFGKESAMYAGFKNAKGDYTITIDADMQQDPKLISRMLAEVHNDSECDSVVYYQKKRKENRIMSFIKGKFYSAINRISLVEFYPGASDFRLFRRNIVDAILNMTETVRFSKGIFSWVGFNKKYLPYTPEDRTVGKSKWGFFKLLRYAVSGITSFSEVPLKIASYFGVVISITAFIYMIIVIMNRLIFGVDVPGYATIVGLVLLIGGIQLVCIGIIGEYLSKTYIETKKRPIYLVRKTYKNELVDAYEEK